MICFACVKKKELTWGFSSVPEKKKQKNINFEKYHWSIAKE